MESEIIAAMVGGLIAGGAAFMIHRQSLSAQKADFGRQRRYLRREEAYGAILGRMKESEKSARYNGLLVALMRSDHTLYGHVNAVSSEVAAHQLYVSAAFQRRFDAFLSDAIDLALQADRDNEVGRLGKAVSEMRLYEVFALAHSDLREIARRELKID